MKNVAPNFLLLSKITQSWKFRDTSVTLKVSTADIWDLDIVATIEPITVVYNFATPRNPVERDSNSERSNDLSVAIKRLTL